MTAQFARAPHQGRSNSPVHSAPNAALLIDFDNVTMGIRSDLSKELKNLLNSDIIKGKVAVQRAYADWRRYPQYIVPLAEASVDLIFAPAYGSSKKNATDIRLAIDALELVFIRPEIGTFILLSGDSDFSSLVLKLKEYGKYVIGVGIRESASDLLVQNCDEYFSYSVLSGLTRETDEPRQIEDPWTLVRQAVGRMAEQGDVMRSDRLKQVMLELDPNFNEKEIGYSKFSKFLTDAVDRGCLRLRKGENGQWEVVPAGVEEAARTPTAEPRIEPRVEARIAQEEPRRSRGGRGRRDGERSARERREVEAPEPKPEAAPAGEPRAEAAPAGELRGDLRSAYQLLRRAVSDIIGHGATAARDSDVKRRMLELEPGWDESTLGFSKFSRFLRQAHDAEAIDLRRDGNGIYEVALPGTKTWRTAEEHRAEPESAERESEAAKSRRPKPSGAEPTRARSGAATAEAPVAKAKPVDVKAVEEKAAGPKAAEAVPAAPTAAEVAPAAGRGPAAGSRGIGLRIGSRGRAGGPKGPPPLLPGQAVVVAENRNGDQAPGRAEEERPATADAGKASGSGAEAGSDGTKPSVPAAETPVEAKPAAKRRRSRGSRGGRGKRTGAASAEAVASVGVVTPSLTELLGLPTGKDEVRAYLSGYKGVGQKTADVMIESFGAAEVFEALESQVDRVREVLGGGRRADSILSAWKVDLAGRSAGAPVQPAVQKERSTPKAAAARKAEAVKTEDRKAETPKAAAPKAESAAAAPETPAAEAGEQTGAGRRSSRGGRRGGRRGGKKTGQTEAPAKSR